ncbi:hypothetical protein ACTA71_011377 [Dictyostelium dimigraforme]
MLLINSLNFRNYNILNNLIDNNNNNKYKIIKLISIFNNDNNNHPNSNNNKLIKVFKTLKEFENELFKQNKKLIPIISYKKILINVNNHNDSMTVLSSIKYYPLNCRFNLIIASDGRISKKDIPIVTKDKLNAPTTDYQDLNNFSHIEFDDETKNQFKTMKRINKITIMGEYMNELFDENIETIFNKICQLYPRKLKFNPIYDRHISKHFNYPSCIFNLKSLKSLKFGIGDYIDLIDILKIDNKTTNIKNLSFHFQFHPLIKSRYESGIYVFGKTCRKKYLSTTRDHGIHRDLDGKNFSSSIESLSKNSKIKKLNFSDYCRNRLCLFEFENQQPQQQFDFQKQLNKELGLLITSPFNRIETLMIENWFFNDTHFYECLATNKNIKTITINHYNIEPFFKYTLSTNKTIRNLIIKSFKGFNDKFEPIHLKPYMNSIISNLYSISILIVQSSTETVNFFNFIFDNLSSPSKQIISPLNLISLKEFNIYYRLPKYASHPFFKEYSIIKPQSILNGIIFSMMPHYDFNLDLHSIYNFKENLEKK